MPSKTAGDVQHSSSALPPSENTGSGIPMAEGLQCKEPVPLTSSGDVRADCKQQTEKGANNPNKKLTMTVANLPKVLENLDKHHEG